MIFTGVISLVAIALAGAWELVLILAVLLLLLGAGKLPWIMRGIGSGMSRFREEVDDVAHDAGRSAGGILGKPAAEAITPDNQTAELYDPEVFRRRGGNWPAAQFVRKLWRKFHAWLKIQR